MTNRPIILAALLTVAALGSLRAQPPILPPIQLVVKPAVAPMPALKFRLLPELRDTKPGNSAQFYYRAFSPEWQGYRRDQKFYVTLQEVANASLKDMPRDKLKEVSGVANGSMLREVDKAARLQYCDWNLTERMREEGINMLLPDVQAMREFATLLRVRAKLELIDGRYDKAAYTLQTGLKLGRDVADGPTLIQSLVGIAVCTSLLEVVDEWVQVSDAPNLYWALTDLPRPMISLRKSLQSERMVIDTYFPGYRELLVNPRAAPSSPQQVEEHLDKAMPLFEYSRNTRAQIVALVMRSYPEAKKFLSTRGHTADQVEALPVAQAVLLHQIAQYDSIYEDIYKYTSLPYWEARPGLLALGKQIQVLAEEAGGRDRTLANILLPAVAKISDAQVRLDRKIAALRCVEAIRLHAAAHEGKLPAQLDDIKEVPVPIDPRTGKPFVYDVKDNKATLTGVTASGEQAHAGNYLRYEITLQK